MTTTPYENLNDSWQASARYTAVADTDILLGNIGANYLRWSTTSDDTAPLITVGQAQIIQAFEERSMTLKAGTRIWLAGEGTTAAMEIQ